MEYMRAAVMIDSMRTKNCFTAIEYIRNHYKGYYMKEYFSKSNYDIHMRFYGDRILLRKLCRVMAMIVALTLLRSGDVSADTLQDAKNAYAYFLETHPEYNEFALTDINDDNIPEMKVKGGGMGVYGIYSYFNGHMTEAGPGIKAIAEEAYTDTGTVLYSRTYKDGSYEKSYYQLRDGVLNFVCSNTDNNHFTDGYGNAISEDQYYSILYQYVPGNCTGIRPFVDFYENTSSNRERYLTGSGMSGNEANPSDETETHDMTGTWKNDNCLITIGDGTIFTQYYDESGQFCQVSSSYQGAQDGDYFYAYLNNDNSGLYFFNFTATQNHLHIWAEPQHNGYVAGILGPEADAYFTRTSDNANIDEISSPITGTNNVQQDTGTNGGGYVIPDSSTRYLSLADLEEMTLQEMNYARNEIAARHGRKFKSKELTEYFSTKSWYNPTLEPEEYDARVNEILNDYEKENSNFLLSWERNEFHPDGYILDQEGYDINDVRVRGG